MSSSGSNQNDNGLQLDKVILDKNALENLHKQFLLGAHSKNDEDHFWAFKNILQVNVGPWQAQLEKQIQEISQTLGKQVQFKLVVEDPNFDRSVVRCLSSCLVHMLRNSLDHGIELPEKRAAKGKPEIGSIQLFMSKNFQTQQYHFALKDDGAGINKNRVVERALAKGLIKEPPETDQEVFNLLFLPGFSTAEAVTDISGRGVGMDFVKSEIESLGGSIVIESQENQGSIFNFFVPMPSYEKFCVPSGEDVLDEAS